MVIAIKRDIFGYFLSFGTTINKYSFRLNELLYIQSRGSYLEIVTYETSYIVVGTLRKCMEEMHSLPVLQISRSIIVNMNNIQNWDDNITLKGTEIILKSSRRMKKEARSLFQNYKTEQCLSSYM